MRTYLAYIRLVCLIFVDSHRSIINIVDIDVNLSNVFLRSNMYSYEIGPGMGGPLRSCAVCARMLSLLWKKPLIGNVCP